MAIATASDIVREVQAHYKGIDSTSVIDYLNIVVNELCRDLPLTQSKFSLALTADTGEYAFAASAPWYSQGTTNTATSISVLKINSAHYREDSDSYSKLEAVSTQELDAKDPNWQYHDSGKPRYIYTTNNATGVPTLGLYPKPNTTSDPANGSGFPRVDFIARVKYGAAFVTTDPIPAAISDPEVLIHGVLWRIYERENNANYEKHYQLYLMAKARLYNEITNRLRDYKPTNTPTLRSPRVV